MNNEIISSVKKGIDIEIKFLEKAVETKIVANNIVTAYGVKGFAIDEITNEITIEDFTETNMFVGSFVNKITFPISLVEYFKFNGATYSPEFVKQKYQEQRKEIKMAVE